MAQNSLSILSLSLANFLWNLSLFLGEKLEETIAGSGWSCFDLRSIFNLVNQPFPWQLFAGKGITLVELIQFPSAFSSTPMLFIGSRRSPGLACPTNCRKSFQVWPLLLCLFRLVSSGMKVIRKSKDITIAISSYKTNSYDSVWYNGRDTSFFLF